MWIVRNSWGADWGSNGVFFVVAGHNYYCMEGETFAVFPEQYDGYIASRGDSSMRGKTNYLDPDPTFSSNNTRSRSSYFYLKDGEMEEVEECPDSIPYVEKDGLCVYFCQSGMFEIGEDRKTMFCVDSCSAKFIRRIDGIQCVPKCTSRYPDLDGSECTCLLEDPLQEPATCQCYND